MEEYLDEIPEPFKEILFDPTVGKIIFLILVFIFIVSIIKILQTTTSKRIEDTRRRYQVRKILDILGIIIFSFILTIVFSDKLGNLTVAFGVAGAGIAFALKEIIASIAGWIAISFNSFFKPGDRVMFGGICGDIIDIGIFRTTLMECGGWVDGDLYNGRIVRISNSCIFTDPVYNYNTDFPFLWDEIKIPICYGSDFKLTRNILDKICDSHLEDYSKKVEESWSRIARKYMLENALVQHMITMEANENWVTFTVRYVVDYTKRRTTKDLLFSKLLEEFESHEDIKIASNTLDITQLPTVKIERI